MYLVWLESFSFAFLFLMTQQGFDILWMLRPRLSETGKFIGCQDQDSSRLRDFLDVETRTHQDWEISWMSKPRLIETGKYNECWDPDQLRLGKRCRYRDSIETLADLCYEPNIVHISPIYHENQGHISVIWNWEIPENVDPLPPHLKIVFILNCGLF